MKLLEYKRIELLNKSKAETPKRYQRRMNYIHTIKPLAVAKDLFIKTGTLTIPINVGDYIVTVHISSIMKYIRDELDAAKISIPTRPIVYKALRKAVDESDLYINCTCPDFRYRFAYWSTKKNYKYGKPEIRPSNITNPSNRGSICKHVTAALVRPSQWIKYADSWICSVVREYLKNKLDISFEDIKDIEDEDAELIKDEIEDIKDLNKDIAKHPEKYEQSKNEDESSQDEDADVKVEFDEIPTHLIRHFNRKY